MGGRQDSEVQSYIDRDIIKRQERLGSVEAKLFETKRKILFKKEKKKNEKKRKIQNQTIELKYEEFEIKNV